MPSERRTNFPLFPLPVVLLPTESMPLHIFEDRYKQMIAGCMESESEFGIIWLADDGLRETGCTARVTEVLERMEDGSMNIICRGGTPFRLIERAEDEAFPTGKIDLLEDRSASVSVQPSGARDAHARYAELVATATDNEPDRDEIDRMSAYEMAAGVDIGLTVKQSLLEMRTEQARLSLLARLFKDGVERLEAAKRIGQLAKVNGKVRFDLAADDD